MASGIYRIRNIHSGKCYVGSAVNIEARWRVHKHDLNHGAHHSVSLQRAWSKHGSVSFVFEVIETVDDTTLLLEREQYYLSSNFTPDGKQRGYNISPSAGNCKGVKHTPEMVQKLKDREITPEWRANMSKAHKGKKPSDSDRKKRSESLKKWYKNPDNRRKHSDSLMGRKCSSETANKISRTQKGKIIPLEQRERISKTLTGKVQSEYTKEKRTKSVREVYSNPEFRDRFRKLKQVTNNTPEFKEKMRIATTNRYQDPEQRRLTSEKMKEVWAQRKANI